MVTTREAYCPRCGEVTTVVQTVPYQPDMCRSCGADIESDEQTPAP